MKHYRDVEAKSKLGFAVSDVLMDIVVLATPLPITWGLQMPATHTTGLSLTSPQLSISS